VIEVDGGKFHSTGWQKRRDADRDALLLAHGYAGLRVTEEEFAETPERAVQVAAGLVAGR
jgi:very-short-patch-repair endonuclease